MPSKQSYLETGQEYHSLSIRDLLEARDAYHVFLMRKRNVVGTAVGKFRIRIDTRISTGPKTLENTKIESYSWPCILVFVKEWALQKDFGQKKKYSNDDYIPRQLYLPDGRQVPVCVIQVSWEAETTEFIPELNFPGSVIGGGYPIMTRVQGEERWATLTGLFSDGRLTYGLTNAHVAGRAGDFLYSLKAGNIEQIGVSSNKQLHKQPFTTVYEELPGKHTLINMDIGLIELDNLQETTSQIFGLGQIRGVEDVNHDTLSLNLIGCPVKGYGCVSGIMQGEIIGLFYRYSTSGGYDYVADYLIGPRILKNSRTVLPFSPGKGDSGTLLVIDDPVAGSQDDMKAIAVLWGGQAELSGGKQIPFGLATNLGTVCRCLDVELVCDWNTTYERYFGAYAHMVIPDLCSGLVKEPNLKSLMLNNQRRICKPLDITEISQTKGLDRAGFIPLSDVADLVWKNGKTQRGNEGPNHFADMDQPGPDGKTLLDLCSDPANVDPAVWIEYYRSIDSPKMGALPFRVAQIFDEMTRAVKSAKPDEFVCAAGILTHYIMDACQPLHISHMYDGDLNGPMKTITEGGKPKEVPITQGIHSVFDNQMVEYFSEEIKQTIGALITQKEASNLAKAAKRIKSPRDAAITVIMLMRDTVNLANPADIVQDYAELLDIPKKKRCEQLWQKYGQSMKMAMAEAVVLIAHLWEAAWKIGDGSNHITSTEVIPEDTLKQLYQDRKFLESVKLTALKGKMGWDDNWN